MVLNCPDSTEELIYKVLHPWIVYCVKGSIEGQGLEHNDGETLKRYRTEQEAADDLDRIKPWSTCEVRYDGLRPEDFPKELVPDLFVFLKSWMDFAGRESAGFHGIKWYVDEEIRSAFFNWHFEYQRGDTDKPFSVWARDAGITVKEK